MRILGSSRPISPQRAMFLCGIAAGACHQVTLLRDPLDSSLYDAMCYPSCGVGLLSRDNKKAVLSHGEQRDAAANFERPTYRILKWHSAVSLPEHGFLVGLYLQIADYAGLLSKVSEDVATEIAKKCRRRRQPHCRLTPLPEEPPRISAYSLPYISRN